MFDQNSPEAIENLPVLKDVVIPGDPDVLAASQIQALEREQGEASEAGVDAKSESPAQGVEAEAVSPANIDTAAIGALVDRILERRLPQLRAELISEVSQTLASEESPTPPSDP